MCHLAPSPRQITYILNFLSPPTFPRSSDIKPQSTVVAQLILSSRALALPGITSLRFDNIPGQFPWTSSWIFGSYPDTHYFTSKVSERRNNPSTYSPRIRNTYGQPWGQLSRNQIRTLARPDSNAVGAKIPASKLSICFH